MSTKQRRHTAAVFDLVDWGDGPSTAAINESPGPSWVTPANSKTEIVTMIPKPSNPNAVFYVTDYAWNPHTRIGERQSWHSVEARLGAAKTGPAQTVEQL